MWYAREGVDDMRTRVKTGYAVLVVSYLATELSILLGCQPFHKNWQINPDPGSEFTLYPFPIPSSTHLKSKI